jgi:hypothetical protein
MKKGFVGEKDGSDDRWESHILKVKLFTQSRTVRLE